MFGRAVIELVANKQTWNTIGCTLAPKGWSPETPITTGRVVLSQPEMRTAERGHEGGDERRPRRRLWTGSG